MPESVSFENVLCVFFDKPGFKANVTFDGDSLIIGHLSLRFFLIRSITVLNYSVNILTDVEAVTFSKLGYDFERFVEQLYHKYNHYLIAGFYRRAASKLTVHGKVEWENAHDDAEIQLYSDSVCIMPMHQTAVRIPLCFIREVSAHPHKLCIIQDTLTQVNIEVFGALHECFISRLSILQAEQQMRTSERFSELLSQPLSSMQSIAPLLLNGRAATLKEIQTHCAVFTSQFDAFSASLPLSREYAFLKSLGGLQTAVGILPNSSLDNPSFWLTAPFGASGHRFAALELHTGTLPAATYLYRISDWPVFLQTLNHVMEAFSYQWELVHISEHELSRPENERIALALRLIPELKSVRSAFLECIKHRSFESWKHAILAHLE